MNIYLGGEPISEPKYNLTAHDVAPYLPGTIESLPPKTLPCTTWIFKMDTECYYYSVDNVGFEPNRRTEELIQNTIALMIR